MDARVEQELLRRSLAAATAAGDRSDPARRPSPPTADMAVSRPVGVSPPPAGAAAERLEAAAGRAVGSLASARRPSSSSVCASVSYKSAFILDAPRLRAFLDGGGSLLVAAAGGASTRSGKRRSDH